MPYIECPFCKYRYYEGVVAKEKESLVKCPNCNDWFFMRKVEGIVITYPIVYVEAKPEEYPITSYPITLTQEELREKLKQYPYREVEAEYQQKMAELYKEYAETLARSRQLWKAETERLEKEKELKLGLNLPKIPTWLPLLIVILIVLLVLGYVLRPVAEVVR